MGMQWPNPGGLSAADFIVSPSPWVTSSSATGVVRLDFRDATLSGSAADITYVSKWVTVNNMSSGTISVAFTRRGFDTANYFSLSAYQSFGADLRISSIWISGSLGQPYQVIAGLTGIQSRHLPVVTASNGFPGVG